MASAGERAETARRRALAEERTADAAEASAKELALIRRGVVFLSGWAWEEHVRRRHPDLGPWDGLPDWQVEPGEPTTEPQTPLETPIAAADDDPGEALEAEAEA